MSDGQSIHVSTQGGAYFAADVNIGGGGTLIGGDQINNHYEYKISLPTADIRQALLRATSQGYHSPYRPDGPFQFDDYPLFAGRQREISAVTDLINRYQVVIVTGAAGIGKSSLLAAGVFPPLASQISPGAQIIELNDYLDPESFFEGWLTENRFSSPGQLPAQLTRIITESEKRFVLFLDSLERYLDPLLSEQRRTALRGILKTVIEAVPQEKLRLVLSCRDNDLTQLKADPLFGDLMSQAMTFTVTPFDFQQAREAIVEPLKISQERLIISEALLQNALLPDLDRLSPSHPSKILPADCQVVAHRLFLLAQEALQPSIDEPFYQKAHGGFGIDRLVSEHLKQRLIGIVPGHEDVALTLFSQMTDPQFEAWVPLKDLEALQTNSVDIKLLVNRLAAAGLLDARVVDGRWVVAFGSIMLANFALRLADPETRSKVQARERLEYMWVRYFNDSKALPTADQLRELQGDQALGQPEPLQAILLLRAASECGLPLQPWIQRLEDGQTLLLIRLLEEADDQGKSSLLVQRPAVLSLLDLDGQPFEPNLLSKTAVGSTSSSTAVQEVAAAMLTAAYGAAAQARIMAQMPNPQEPHIGMRVLLSDLNEEIAADNRQRPWSWRWRIWWGRFRKRIYRYGGEIGRRAFASGFGVALLLGLWRMLIALAGREYNVGPFFGVGFFFGFITGSSVMYAVLVSRLFTLPPEALNPFDKQNPIRPGRRTAIISGTVAFALAQIIVALISFSAVLWNSPLLLLFFVGGAGVAWAVWDLPEEWDPIAAKWRMLLAGGLVAAAHLPAVFAQQSGWFYRIEYPIVEGIENHRTFFAVYLPEGIKTSFPNWAAVPFLLDSTITGIIIAWGVIWGGSRFYRWLVRQAE